MTQFLTNAYKKIIYIYFTLVAKRGFLLVTRFNMPLPSVSDHATHPLSSGGRLFQGRPVTVVQVLILVRPAPSKHTIIQSHPGPVLKLHGGCDLLYLISVLIALNRGQVHVILLAVRLGFGPSLWFLDEDEVARGL